MLVTFKSTSYADITMFGDVAEKLLKLMGQSGNVPGAITHEHVPAALQALNSGISAQAVEDSSNAADDDDAPISLATRAQPLIQLLEAAIAGGTDVLWEN